MKKKAKEQKAGAGATPAVPGMDKDWRGESDARTLSEAEGIRNDPKRLEGARCHLEYAVTAYRAAGRGIKRARKGKMRGVKTGRY